MYVYHYGYLDIMSYFPMIFQCQPDRLAQATSAFRRDLERAAA
jgi:hypothetical protein